MSFQNLADLEAREIVPGYHGKFFHTDHMTVAHWQVEAHAVMPAHAHPHEQIMTVLEGRFEFTLAGETRTIEPGDVIVIPGNVVHSGKALTACRIVDAFYPCREDYR